MRYKESSLNIEILYIVQPGKSKNSTNVGSMDWAAYNRLGGLQWLGAYGYL
jgi:hypothetical protein